jgi:hypothetical protein
MNTPNQRGQIAMPATTTITRYARIGDFELSFWIDLEPFEDGWLWSAIGEDDMTDWFHGDELFASAGDAEGNAIAFLTPLFS